MITSKRMRALEINSDSLGVSTLQLMENAGRAVVEEIEKEVSLDNVSATVFVGHGGKGGDGLVVARQLAGRGAKVRVILLGEIKHKDALVNLNAVMEMDYSVELKEVYDLSELTPTKSDVLIDAMLGTGVKGKIREPFVTAIEVFNKSQGFKVSIDVPSGLDPDTGESLGAHVTPDLVVTFHDMKVGLLKVGFRTVVKKIGIPPEAELYVGPGDLMVNLKPRDMKSRKGVGGRVLVVGGVRPSVEHLPLQEWLP
jgi:yjeF N-terminal region